MTRRLLVSCMLLLCAAPLAAQVAAERPNSILLIAKPNLVDPNFREAVVLVTQARDYSTVGVILNRPTDQRLDAILPRVPGVENYAEPVYFGGPVMRQVVVALFRSADPPRAAAFPVLKDLYLTMHPANIEPLFTAAERYRLYTGFSGWAPRQLESELERDAWYVLPATEELVFRKDTSGMWTELLEKARGSRTGLSGQIPG